MIYGNWVGIHKGFVKALPTDRKYTELEAAFSVSVDIDNNRLGSVLGYANQWSWNRKTVKRFLDVIGVEIIYPEELGKKQNQRGQIRGQIRDRSGTDKGQIRIIIDKALHGERDRSGTDKGQIRDRSGDTTIDPINPNPNPDKKKSKKSFSDDSIEMKIVRYFIAVLRKSDPEMKEPNLQNWCADIDKLIRINNRSPSDIKKVINHAHDPKNSTDKFSWIPNLRSPKKLRDHFTTIFLQCGSVPQQDDGSAAAAAAIERTNRLLNDQ